MCVWKSWQKGNVLTTGGNFSLNKWPLPFFFRVDILFLTMALLLVLLLLLLLPAPNPTLISIFLFSLLLNKIDTQLHSSNTFHPIFASSFSSHSFPFWDAFHFSCSLTSSLLFFSVLDAKEQWRIQKACQQNSQMVSISTEFGVGEALQQTAFTSSSCDTAPYSVAKNE